MASSFYEEKSTNRLIRKALAAGVQLTAEDVLELDGIVNKDIMPQLIKRVSHPLSAEQLDEFSFWLSGEEMQALANKHHIRLDESGYAITPELEVLELQETKILAQEEIEQEELERMQAAQAIDKAEEMILTRWLICLSRKHRREHNKKKRNL